MLAQIYNQIDTAIKWVDDRIWGLPLIILILTTGIYLTVRLGGLQIRHLPKALRFMVKNEEEVHGEVTSFGALCTALSATIGTGNITGVATAIAAGGPGALFWMVVAAFFGMVYVAVMLSFIYLTRSLPDGKFLVWLIFLCSWGCDTCAYCVGMLIGKHKMAPVLSPKKSIEGAVGGVVGAALLGVIYAAATQGKMAEYALICAVGALISMVGDLAASAIKRNQNIKDYGKLIPGHGGILDRFDSVIITAPVIYYLAKIILGI